MRLLPFSVTPHAASEGGRRKWARRARKRNGKQGAVKGEKIKVIKMKRKER